MFARVRPSPRTVVTQSMRTVLSATRRSPSSSRGWTRTLSTNSSAGGEAPEGAKSSMRSWVMVGGAVGLGAGVGLLLPTRQEIASAHLTLSTHDDDNKGSETSQGTASEWSPPAIVQRWQAQPELPTAVVHALQEALGDRCVLDVDERQSHGKDWSFHNASAPMAVVYPESVEEIKAVVAVCQEHGVPLVPYGSGTSLEGHTTAPAGGRGVCMDLSHMREILRLSVEDMDVTVQPGISYGELNDALKEHGLFFGVDPGPGASIGGMCSTNCSGTHAVRYGTMKDNVLSMKVLLADGRVVSTGQRARKSSMGYNLTNLFVGAEGTLGVILEVTLKLQQIPPSSSVAVCAFDDLEQATRTVVRTMQAGVQIGRVELLDAEMIRAVNLNSGTRFAEKATLFFEFSGTEAVVAEQTKSVLRIAKEQGCAQCTWATDESEKQQLWQARKIALWSAPMLRPGAQVWTTDVCVPISRLSQCIKETQADIDASFLKAPLVGHVGDGNFHLFILVDPDNETDMAEARRLNERLVHRAIAMDGTATGEHGVGIGKRKYMTRELGPEAVGLMQQIKQLLDPKGIMNPGKQLPDENLQPAVRR